MSGIQLISDNTDWWKYVQLFDNSAYVQESLGARRGGGDSSLLLCWTKDPSWKIMFKKQNSQQWLEEHEFILHLQPFSKYPSPHQNSFILQV